VRVAAVAESVDVTGDLAEGTPAPAGVYVILSILAGGALAFISLESLYGFVLAFAAGMLLIRQARGHRWFALGGLLLGTGLCAAGFLSPALTNHDRAVTYDPSTIPVLWIAVGIALCGAVTGAVATRAARRRRPAC
jgi:hypothetical protein